MKNLPTPKLQRVLETSLYVDDIQRSRIFYEEIMQLEPIYQNTHLCALSISGTHLLLIFKKESTLQPVETTGGVIPPHHGSGSLHLAFAIRKEDLMAWKQRLAEYGIPLLSEVQWPRGGISLYFRDPDEHLIELATPGLWSIY